MSKKPATTCPGCGIGTTQLDMRQKDSDGNYWHCKCADDALAKIAESIKGVEG